MTRPVLPGIDTAGQASGWAFLSHIQHNSFAYFLHESSADTGLVRDKTRPDWPASIAATGMALTVYPIGVERGWMSRAQALERTLTTLHFLASSVQSSAADASGYRVFFTIFWQWTVASGSGIASCRVSILRC